MNSIALRSLSEIIGSSTFQFISKLKGLIAESEISLKSPDCKYVTTAISDKTENQCAYPFGMKRAISSS